MSRKASFEEVSHGGYRGRLINWEKWLDGEGHILEAGKDFSADRADSTRSAGRQWCDRHGLDVRTLILSPSDGDTVFALARDLEAAGHAEFAERAWKLNPKFYFEVTGGLSDEQIAVARQAQELSDGGASDARLAEELSKARRGVPSDGSSDENEPEPVLDPVAARREKLSDQSPREVVATTRPMSRKRRV